MKANLGIGSFCLVHERARFGRMPYLVGVGALGGPEPLCSTIMIEEVVHSVENLINVNSPLR